MKPIKEVDALVIGGGVVGLSLAYGMARAGDRVRVLDEGDDALRAARGNFGLVWVQGKGSANPSYASWTMDSVRHWPAFAAELRQRTGVDVELSQLGGFMMYLTEHELASQHERLESLRRQVGRDYPFQVLDHEGVRALVPCIGPEVAGATYCPLDGHVSPLRLLRALLQACATLGVQFHPGMRVDWIAYRDGLFHVHSGGLEHVAPRLVLAAGLGNKALAPTVGLKAPVVPNRGQILVTERLQPFLPYPTALVRQTGEGVVQIGDSKEDVGLDDRTTVDQLASIADRARRFFPLLESVNVVRTWGALRVMSPDGMPIYQASTQCPGAFVVTCHSGVTLAAQHAGALVDWIRGGAEPADIHGFKAERFDVQTH